MEQALTFLAGRTETAVEYDALSGVETAAGYRLDEEGVSRVLALEKPAGMVVHPTLGAKDGTLANAFCGLMERRGTPAPFRSVNRLDRGTSGLVLCAMNAWAAPLLAKSVRKEYLAAVRGVPQPAEGTWRSSPVKPQASITGAMVMSKQPGSS